MGLDASELAAGRHVRGTSASRSEIRRRNKVPVALGGELDWGVGGKEGILGSDKAIAKFPQGP